ncbi:hypothetical protein A4H97_09665 [Niastella yeongjuensis]|uniref:Lipocalin-like domain-containing protein n=1 Tax=Niastella yeongjuensis TaxID=354355 RepID=A0A1V9EFC0_9BACT|nr:DUF5991 domain-containing protein [Niastella yeongjuensis]OQP44625.1 hypothetical protein A4H97_09665 [Niastella yeongjuensis]SEO80890.1 hypothetical protein SAMN05660816_03609 [Niastella yeongjuensis]
MNRLFVLLLCFTLSSCSKSNSFAHCTDWVGDYSYHELPVPTATGINKIMEWELSVTQQHDTCFGTLEITGLTTYIKLLTTLSGDSSQVEVAYYKYLDGSQDFKPGEVLFSLNKDGETLLTDWKTLQPMLVEFPAMEGICFNKLKKRKPNDL